MTLEQCVLKLEQRVGKLEGRFDRISAGAQYKEAEVLSLLGISRSSLFEMQKAGILMWDMRVGTSERSPRRWFGSTLLAYKRRGGTK